MNRNPNADDYRPAPDLDAYDWEHSADDHEDEVLEERHLCIAAVARALSLATDDEAPGVDPMLEAVGALQVLLSEDDFAHLAACLEVCPMHLCDAQICADDDVTECEATRT